jgi:amidohydrolase
MNVSCEVSNLKDELVQVRRSLHQIPETAYGEHETNAFLQKYLEKLKPDRIDYLAGTGIKAVFLAPDATSAMAFRADMDALPIPEENECVYSSRHEGAMHACGHDAHMAMLLILGKLVSERRKGLKKHIVLIFQPAEETDGGAETMIAEGVLQDPIVDEIYGMHLWPDIPAGKVGIKEGAVMASMCDLNIEISGRGAHGAKPHLGIDAIVAAGQLLGMLQTVVSRSVDPYERAVITVGKIEGGTARNVICEKVMLEGTIRTFKPLVFENARNRIQGILKGLETAFGVETRYFETMNYPPVINSDALVQNACKLFDAADISPVKPIMISEDFSYYQKAIPGLYLFLGIADDEHTEPLHSSTFDFNEQVMLYGVETFKRLAGL